MWRSFVALIAVTFTGCAQLPPTTEDIQAKTFSSVPGKAVIYIVRDALGPPLGETLSLNDRLQITTYAGTYYRWETEPGSHRIDGYASSVASITLNTEPGKIYFVKHMVTGTSWDGVMDTFLERLDDETGREFVRDARLL